MNRQERRNAMKEGTDTLKRCSLENRSLKTERKKLVAEISELESQVEQGRELITQLTAQIEDAGRSYMFTLGAIAKANGGIIRIPCSAIDSVQEDDVLENRLDELNDCIVFTIRRPGTDAPSGIILAGRDRR